MSELKNCPFCGSANTMIDDIVELEGKTLHTAFCGDCQSKSSNFCDYNDAVNAWNTRADGWISVEDELPLDNGFVIARSIGITDSVYYTGTLILYFSKAYPKGQQFHSSSRITHVTCTHWMPLPNPPTTK